MRQVDLSPSSPASVSKGWGAFFNPPVFVGTPLDREALNRQNNGCRAFVKALDAVYKGRQMIVSREGLVVLAEPQMAAAVELLNEVMVVLLIRSVPVNGVRETDLLECSIDTANREIAGGEWWHEARKQTSLERDFEGFNARFYHPDNVRSFIRRAELVTSHPAARADLRLLMEAFTLHQESAFAASFLLSWSGAARLLQAEWRRQTKQPHGNDGAESVNSDPCAEVARVIEELYSCNAVDALTYQEAKRLREKHSNIIKSEREATMGESEACFHFFLSQLRKSLSSAEL